MPIIVVTSDSFIDLLLIFFVLIRYLLAFLFYNCGAYLPLQRITAIVDFRIAEDLLWWVIHFLD